MQVVVRERAVFERVRFVAGLLEVAVVERVGVDDQRAAGGHVLEIRLQGGGVHRNENARPISRGEDVVVGEVHLETRDARQRACRGSDLGREVGERRKIVPEHRRLAGEAIAGELHPVARVAREPDDDVIDLLDRLGAHGKRVASGATVTAPVRPATATGDCPSTVPGQSPGSSR